MGDSLSSSSLLALVSKNKVWGDGEPCAAEKRSVFL